jgi:hypothetical protein
MDAVYVVPSVRRTQSRLRHSRLTSTKRSATGAGRASRSALRVRLRRLPELSLLPCWRLRSRAIGHRRPAGRPRLSGTRCPLRAVLAWSLARLICPTGHGQSLRQQARVRPVGPGRVVSVGASSGDEEDGVDVPGEASTPDSSGSQLSSVRWSDCFCCIRCAAWRCANGGLALLAGPICDS